MIAILDIDGTLVDTNYQHAIAWFRAFRSKDILLPIWRIHRHLGMGGDQVVKALRRARPDLVHAALDKAGGKGSDAVLVGDTPWDVEAARRAGVTTIAVLTGGFAAQELTDAGAISVFESVGELRERLDVTALR